MWKNVYLARVYRYSPRWFLFVLSFALLTLVCNIAGVEITPFFVWGMYSEKIQPPASYTFYTTTVNDSMLVDTYSGYPDNSRFYLNIPLAYYEDMRAHAGIDPVIPFLQRRTGSGYRWIRPLEGRLFNGGLKGRFPGWYSRYLEQTLAIPVNTVKIGAVRVHYDAAQHLVTDSTYFVEAW
jgi:hypothetical protein